MKPTKVNYSTSASPCGKTSKKKPSIRYTAFRFLVKITDKHPELRKELNFLLEPRYFETLSPGVKKGVYKMLKMK